MEVYGTNIKNVPDGLGFAIIDVDIQTDFDEVVFVDTVLGYFGNIGIIKPDLMTHEAFDKVYMTCHAGRSDMVFLLKDCVLSGDLVFGLQTLENIKGMLIEDWKKQYYTL